MWLPQQKRDGEPCERVADLRAGRQKRRVLLNQYARTGLAYLRTTNGGGYACYPKNMSDDTNLLPDTPPDKASTGVAGLDAILNGGLPRDWSYMVRGDPGTGKTTLGLQFLLAGLAAGEAVLYVTLGHTARELREIARSHGWSLSGMQIHELSEDDAVDAIAADQLLLHPADVELGEVIERFFEAIETHQPSRVVFDPIEQVRLMTGSALRYRQQILKLKRFLTQQRCTTLFLAGGFAEDADQDLVNIVHGVIDLERTSRNYGHIRRRLEVTKGRGMVFQEGHHDFEIVTGGLIVYPRLETRAEGAESEQGRHVSSGVASLDTLLGGGLETGSTCLIVGPTGTGKTSLATLYAHSAAERGERSALFLFDERPESFSRRAESLGIGLEEHRAAGRVSVKAVRTGELSPGAFSQAVREQVEAGAKVIVIDSLTGYLSAMPQEELLLTHLHELFVYLGERGVLTLLVMAQRGILGSGDTEPFDVSYLADTVLLLRHFEDAGRVRRALSVIKKRYGDHEATIRELRLTEEGIAVGEPISAFSGILTGTPVFEGNRRRLLEDDDE